MSAIAGLWNERAIAFIKQSNIAKLKFCGDEYLTDIMKAIVFYFLFQV